MATAVVYSSKFLEHKVTPLHPESPRRLAKAMSALRESGLLEQVSLVEPREASLEEIQLVHDPGYVEHVRRLCAAGGGYLDADTPVSRGSFEAAVYAAGAVLKACEMALRGDISSAFALVRPPGHHAGRRGIALRAPSRGFCIFNNVAIAAKAMLERGASRVAILDVDCHHGNGTQEAFYSSSKVLFISLHQHPYTLYPGTGFTHEAGEGDGLGYNINIPLPPMTGDDMYMKLIDEVVAPMLRQFKPELILVSAGFDTHRSDPLTRMLLTESTFLHVFKLLASLSEELKAPVVASLEGGYGEGLERGVKAAIASLAGLELEASEPKTESSRAVKSSITSTVRELEEATGGRWGIEWS